MKVEQAIADGRSGKLRAAYLLVGSETFLVERATRLLRAAAIGDRGVPGFNEDVFHGAKSLDGGKVVAAAQTLPMMADRRFLLIRHVDQSSSDCQAALAAYLAAPNPSTVLVMTAHKVAGNTKLGKAAKKHKARFDANAMKGAALRDFAVSEAEARGHTLAPNAAAALLDALGDDLSAIDDAIERLSLFVGAGQRIDEAAVEACVTRVRADTIWALVDAVSMRDAAKASAAAQSLLADREPPLRILAMVARQIRMVAKMRDALARGISAGDAAREAGVPPFKANAMKEAARRFSLQELTRAFDILADTDLMLKGSRVPGDVALHHAVLALCGKAPKPTRVQRPRRSLV
ncbi:MAG: DNA polymerase III subunit delta [Myxococcota bacterium]